MCKAWVHGATRSNYGMLQPMSGLSGPGLERQAIGKLLFLRRFGISSEKVRTAQRSGKRPVKGFVMREIRLCPHRGKNEGF